MKIPKIDIKKYYLSIVLTFLLFSLLAISFFLLTYDEFSGVWFLGATYVTILFYLMEYVFYIFLKEKLKNDN